MTQEHLEQSWHNEKFLEHIKDSVPSAFNDWKVTVCFYVALHLVRAFLAKKGHASTSHHDTLNCINPSPLERPACPTPLPALYRVYNKMYLNSRTSRYNGFLHKKGFEEFQALKFSETMQCLEKVKEELRKQNLKFERTAHPAPAASPDDKEVK